MFRKGTIRIAQKLTQTQIRYATRAAISEAETSSLSFSTVGAPLNLNDYEQAFAVFKSKGESKDDGKKDKPHPKPNKDPKKKPDPVTDVDKDINKDIGESNEKPAGETQVKSGSTGNVGNSSSPPPSNSNGGGNGDDGNNNKGGPNYIPPKEEEPKLFPPLLAIPMTDRMPIPGRLFSIYITDPEVEKAMEASIENKNPNFVMFHVKGEDKDDSDVIYSKDDIYKVGVHCTINKIDKMENDRTMIVAYPSSRVSLEELVTPDMEGRNQVEPNEDFPTAYLNKYHVSYATTELMIIEDYAKNSPVIRQLVEEIRASLANLTKNSYVNRTYAKDSLNFEPHILADFVTSISFAKKEQIQEVLEAMNVEDRLRLTLDIINIETQISKIKEKSIETIRKNSLENQMKAVMKEFINQMKKEVGISENRESDKIQKLLKKASSLHMPAEVSEVFYSEIEKLKSQTDSASESSVIEKYLDWLVSIPWGKYSKDQFNLKKAKEVLEKDHYGLKDVKQRILEFISMGRLSGNLDGKILCLHGPPGTGKTSIAKSIAEALNRKYTRIAMGGVSDVHELKGHRRTYVGAVPGRIVLALKQAKTQNPLMLIDEIDKLDTVSRGGGAASAFLEILDPEQNNSFVDNYLDVKIDLSKVLFVCTANYIGNIPPPLKDRMEIIDVSGYTTNEKVEIAKRHLIPQAASKAGLDSNHIDIKDETIVRLINKYCRESGLRNTKKQITRIFSKAALKIVEQIDQDESKEAKEETINAENPVSKKDELKEDKVIDEEVIIDTDSSIKSDKKSKRKSKDEMENAPKKFNTDKVDIDVETRNETQSNNNTSEQKADKNEEEEELFTLQDIENAPKLEIPESIKLEITPNNLKDYIGPEIFTRDRIYDVLPAGVATGLAYSGSGNGDALYIESILTNSIGSGIGSAGFKVTGSLKDVMKESASISFSFAKSFLTKHFPDNRFFEAANIHVHCPDGAVPKDGPSAGISFTTSIISLALNKSVPANIAMTGELTVTGRVLAVGGLREKILGAKRYGCDTIIFPKDIENVLDDIPQEVKEGVKFIPVEWYSEVFDAIFPDVTPEIGNKVWEKEFSALDAKKDKKN